MKLYKCNKCNSIYTSNNKNLFCCNKKLEELKPNVVDASKEKHIPKIEIKDNKMLITVGETLHPMEEEHYIMWIIIETEDKIINYDLKPNTKPIIECEVLKNATVYAYCNIHGLWKKTVENCSNHN